MEQALVFPCAQGCEQVLAGELATLGLDNIKIGTAVVQATGTVEQAYRVCLWSRVASRVLLPLARGPVANPDDIYALVKTVAWEEHLFIDTTFAVSFNGSGAGINNSQFGALKCKDAIADRLREKYKRRPDVDSKNPDVLVAVHLRRGELSVALDLAGDGLHQRGYRQAQGAAPLKENLAAALLYRSQWPERAAAGANLIDPLCGSGTLLLEALQMAADIAPGLGRQRFGFSAWQQHTPALWKRLVAEAQERREIGLNRLDLKVWGYDADRDAIHAARQNAARLSLDHCLHLEVRPLAALSWVKGYGPRGNLVCNPPYGERLGTLVTLLPTYEQLGAAFKTFPPDWQLTVISSNADLLRRLQLQRSRSYKASNGGLDVEIACFDRAAQREEPGAAPVNTERSEQARMFANRLRKNFKKYQPLAAALNTDAYRVYDQDMPEYAVAVDIYGDQLHIQEYAPPPTVRPEKARERLLDVLRLAPEVLGLNPEQVSLKTRQRQSGKSQYERRGAAGAFSTVQEGAARFWVNLHDYLDTGLFLDHRPLRRHIHNSAAGKRFLNLFAYTGSFSVQAALGGALHSTSVDASATYLDWARRNFDLNGLDDRHRLVRADVLEFLAGGTSQFDLIVCDPPTFSNSKQRAQTFDVQRDHERLIEGAMARLAPGGTLYFSNNYQRFKLAPALGERFAVENISATMLDFDFQRRPKIHQVFALRHLSS